MIVELGDGDMFVVFFFFQAEDGIRDLVRSRGLGDVYKRQTLEDTPSVRGMIDKVRHLVRIVEEK